MPETIRNVVRDGDVVMTMGAGSISAVPARLVAQAGGKNEQGAA